MAKKRYAIEDAPFQRFQNCSFDSLQVCLDNSLREQKHDYTTPVWSWLGYEQTDLRHFSR